MDVTEVAQRYFDAWNHRDAAAIVAAFTERGTYSDPVAGQGLTGEVLITYAKEMWGAFPDLSYEILTLTTAGRDTVAAQWLMRGTNTASFKALLPTNRSISVRSAEFIWIEGDKRRTVQGYFDSSAVPAQLGLQVVVQLHAIGPFAFRTCSSVQTGKRSKPEAFSITALQAHDDSDRLGNTRGTTVDVARYHAQERVAAIFRPETGGWGLDERLDSGARKCIMSALYQLAAHGQQFNGRPHMPVWGVLAGTYALLVDKIRRSVESEFTP